MQFHGAREQINDTHVRPPSVTGAYPASSLGFSSGADQPPHTDLAFATKLQHSAWQYARPVATHPDAVENNDPDPRHRGRVYEVAPAADQKGDSSEITSPTGFRITAEHHSAPDVTGTFPDINWNAFKGKRGPGRHLSHMDANHAYMDTHAPMHYLSSGAISPKPPSPPPPVREGADEYTNRKRVDSRHPDQLNLMTGKTVAEHNVYNATPGITMHLNPTQFQDTASFHQDPTTDPIRAARGYASVDRELGTAR